MNPAPFLSLRKSLRCGNDYGATADPETRRVPHGLYGSSHFLGELLRVGPRRHCDNDRTIHFRRRTPAALGLKLRADRAANNRRLHTEGLYPSGRFRMSALQDSRRHNVGLCCGHFNNTAPKAPLQ